MTPLSLTVLAGAIGWISAQYVYGQLSATFKERQPLLAALVVGGIVGLVVPSVLNVLVQLTSR